MSGWYSNTNFTLAKKQLYNSTTMNNMEVVDGWCYGSEVPSLIETLKKGGGRPATVSELRQWAKDNPPIEGTTIYALGDLAVHNNGTRVLDNRVVRCRDVAGEVGMYSPSKGLRSRTIVSDRAGYLPGAKFLVVL